MAARTPSREEAELAVLCALCQDAAGGFRAQARRRLARYRFASNERQVVFEALLALPALPADALEPQLAAALTRRGFPDVTLEPYFAPQRLPAEDALAALETFALPADP